jgi:hypothetical protein
VAGVSLGMYIRRRYVRSPDAGTSRAGYPLLRSCLFWVFVSLTLAAKAVTSNSQDADLHSRLNFRVVIRDNEGKPITGLSLSDFRVSFDGQPANLLDLREFSQKAQQASDVATADSARTYLLLIFPPMTLEARNHILSETLRYLQIAATDGWSVAVLDPSANFQPFTTQISQIEGTVRSILARLDTPQYGSAWPEAAHGAMRSLASLPGRHVVVFATDPLFSTTASFKQNPNVVRVGPYLLEGDAVRQMAQLYPVETSRPMTVPFGEAQTETPLSMPTQGSTSGAEAGKMQLDAIRRASELQGASWAVAGDLASATGSRDEDSISKTFRDIETDGAGTYELTLGIDPSYFDGSFYSISVNIDVPKAKVYSAQWLNTPLSPAPAKELHINPELERLLHFSSHVVDVPLHLKAWYFPDNPGSLASIVFAAHPDGKGERSSADALRQFDFAARVTDVAGPTIIRTWGDTLSESVTEAPGHANAANGTSLRIAQLPPGNYVFSGAVRDIETNRGGNSQFRFQVDVPDPNAFLGVSSLLLYTSCSDNLNLGDTRRSLFNPLQIGDCMAEPLISASVRHDQKLYALLRIYKGLAHNDSFPKHWTASVEIWDTSGRLMKEFPAQIDADTSRGWKVSTTLLPSDEHLTTGQYKLAVVLTGPQKRRFAVLDHFQVKKQ